MKKDLGFADNLGTVVFGTIAAAAASAALALWWWRGRHPTVASGQAVADAAEALARSVAAQWETEAELRSLEDPDPMPVRWLLATDDPGLFDAAGQAAAGGWEASSSEVEELAVQFRALKRGRMVVLGGPGSGKTTLAVQLLRELIRTRVEGEPVPVLVSAASWDTAMHRGVWEWTAAQLALTYPALKAEVFGPDACADLVAGPDSLVLPVIDGLDEISLSARVAIVEALNRSVGRGKLILTCRTTDWADTVAAADTVLGGAAVIRPEPLTPIAAADYLRACLRRTPSPAWQQVLDHLAAQGTTPHSPLAHVCSTPLGLWLVRTVYRPPATGGPAPDPAPLTDLALHPAHDELRGHLFDRLIPALIQQRRPSSDSHHLFRPRRAHQPDHVTRWLAWLAHHLTHPKTSNGQPRTRDLAWWNLAHHALTPTRTAITTGLATALVGGLMAGLAGGLVIRLADGFTAGLMIGLTGGLVFGIAGGGIFNRKITSQPRYADLALRGRVKDLLRNLATGLLSGPGTGLTGGILFGIPIGFVFGLVSVLAGGPVVVGLVGGPVLGAMFGNLLGLVFGLPSGLAGGLISWAETPAPEDRASTPIESLHADRALTILRITVFWLPVGFMAGLVAAYMAGLDDSHDGELVLGLVLGSVGGFVGRFMSGDHQAWWQYLVATAHLSRRKLLPRDLMSFLGDAHRLGLLRAVGPVYQFRHADFQDHLARDRDTNAANSTAPP